MLRKLAVSAILLPAFLGISTVAAQAATTQTTSQPEVAQSSLEAAPQYYANNYNYESDCKPSYRRRSSGYYQQNYYRPHNSGYHQTNYYKPHNNGYHQTNYYKPHNNGYHDNGYHNNGYHDNGYNNNGYHH